MYTLQILDKEKIQAFKGLALGEYQQLIETADAELPGNLIAVGAISFLGIPVGLALSKVEPETKTAELYSVAVAAPFRHKGVATDLLGYSENIWQERGCTRVRVSYQIKTSGASFIDSLLIKCGWDTPETSLHIYRKTLNKEALKNNQWVLRQPTLPPGFTMFDWKELTERDREEIIRMHTGDQRYSETTNPLIADFEPLNSLGVRYNGEIVGWCVTRRSSPDTLQYSRLFVRRDLRNMGAPVVLLTEAIRRQCISEEFIPKIVCVLHSYTPEFVKFIGGFFDTFQCIKYELKESGKILAALPEVKTNVLPAVNTLQELLAWRAQHQPEQKAYTFLVDGEREEKSWTYRELDTEARKIASMLKAAGKERALICLPQSLEYISAFFGALYAGVIAVPAYPFEPSRPGHSLTRLEGILKDSGATIVLTSSTLLPALSAQIAENPVWESVRLVAVDSTPANDTKIELPLTHAEDLAFILYTSGSTGSPKGVMISHGNACYNLKSFPGFEIRPLSGAVSWLPFYHTMGLFFGILHPLYRGVHAALLEPLAFIQRPMRWLQAISRYGASMSAGSNFAYNLCANAITAEDKAGLDLSGWNMALIGGEPIRAETLVNFQKAFASCGLSASTLYPSYGMSENTCAISGSTRFESYFSQRVQKKALENNRIVAAAEAEETAVTLISCGQPLEGQKILIVQPETSKICQPGEIGEIWIQGAGVAQGYWNKPAETAATFGAILSGSDEGGTFLRTGDLGFIEAGQVFVTGRLKDMLIIRGRNFYPQDLEQTAERSHALLKAGGSAAFSVDYAGEERAVVICEAELTPGTAATNEIIRAIRAAITAEYSLELCAVTLLAPGALPRTPGGKIQRRECQKAFTAGTFKSIAEWRATFAPATPANSVPVASISFAAIVQHLKNYFARRLEMATHEIDIRQSFAHYGLDSLGAVNLVSELGQLTGQELSPTLTWDYPTIESLSRYLAGVTVAPVIQPEVFSTPDKGREPVAIVGMGCRFPGARNAREYWQLLSEGRDAITEIPNERWRLDEFYDPKSNIPGKMSTRWGGFLENLEQFDPLFFNMAPREAPHLDPRQRLIMEVAWEALEDAGIVPEKLAGSRTGVFMANLANDYGSLLFDDMGRIDSFSGSGTANSIIANRLSYLLDLKGPSMALDTACSGSLVALHLACQSLWMGEINAALVGGVNIILRPDSNLFFTKADALAPDGRCKVFDSRANGIVRSEGAGVVVLKPLSRAIADGDRIYAVVKGSAVNSDGRSKGIMAPDRQAQETVLRDAYRQARVSPGQIQYIEAHGTGTRLGDPIEVQALGAVLSSERATGSYCALGSVKSNIGHTEAASGIAGVLKVALSLYHRQLPPSLHFQNPNPLIPFNELPLRVQTSLGQWPNPQERLIAGVSGFGFGGTNAHVVLEETPQANPVPARQGGKYTLPLSAHNPTALGAMAESYRQFLTSPQAPALYDICYTAGTRRTQYAHRLVVSGQTPKELAERLAAFGRGETMPGLVYSHKSGKSEGKGQNRQRKLVFVFSGQGSHWLGMGRELFQKEAVFRGVLEECERLICEKAGWSLLAELNAPAEISRLYETWVTQPAIFSIQVALAALWRSWGITPDAIVGQSLGEIAAAHVAGALTLDEAVQVVVERSRLMHRTTGQGKTAVVDLPLEQAQLAVASCDDVLAVAGSNSPNTSVLSGDPATLQRVMNYLENKGIFCKLLQGVDIAFHSPQMEPLKQELINALAGITPRETTVPLYSTVTGALIEGNRLDAAYWGRNLRDPFLFTGTLERLAEAGYDTFLEVSPHPVLGSSIGQCFRHFNREVTTLASLRRGESELNLLQNGLSTFYVSGYPVQWSNLLPEAGQVVSLPTYPWQRETYWYTDLTGSQMHFNSNTRRAVGINNGELVVMSAPRLHPFMSEHLQPAIMPGSHVWQGELDTGRLGYLGDHKVQGRTILPGAAYVEMALAAAGQLYPKSGATLENLDFKEALFLTDSTTNVQVTFSPVSEGSYDFSIYSSTQNNSTNWRLHAGGKIRVEAGMPAVQAETLGQIQARCVGRVETAEHYRKMGSRGLEYGPAFQAINQIWRREGEALGQISLPFSLKAELPEYRLHPVLLDACFQLIATTFGTTKGGNDKVLPVGLDALHWYSSPEAQMWCHVTLDAPAETGSNLYHANLSLRNEQGQVLAEIKGMRLKRIQSASTNSAENWQDWLYQLDWQPEKRPANSLTSSQTDSWLIFDEQNGAGSGLSALLRAKGHSTISVTPAATYRAEEGKYELNPTQPADYERLLQEITADKQPPRGIIYLWGLAASTGTSSSEELLKAQDKGSLAALNLVQALGKLGGNKPSQLWIITQGTQAVDTFPNFGALTQTPLWGLGGVILNEHPELHPVRIDLSNENVMGQLEALVQELVQEKPEAQIALRGVNRYVRRLNRYTSPVTSNLAEVQTRVKGDATYLITGGTSGLGLGVAEWLTQQGARHLVLVGRKQPTTETAQVIAALRVAGVTVKVAQVDIASTAEVSALLTEIGATMPSLRGVIHSAGVLDDGILLEQSRERFLKVFGPKIAGAWNLHSLTQNQPLDFFVLFSSIAAVLGAPGQSNYVAANTFLDGLAHFRRLQGLPTLSINWGPWSEIGMAARSSQNGRIGGRVIGHISPASGLECLKLLLEEAPTQAIVMPVNWAEAANRRISGDTALLSNLLSPVAPVQSIQVVEGEVVQTTAVVIDNPTRALLQSGERGQRLGVLENYLKEQVSAILSIQPDRLDIYESLFNMGIDSLMAVELKNRVETDLLIAVPVVLLMQGPSVTELAVELLNQLAGVTA